MNAVLELLLHSDTSLALDILGKLFTRLKSENFGCPFNCVFGAWKCELLSGARF